MSGATDSGDNYGGRLRAARQAAGLSVEEATYRVRVLMDRSVSWRTVERVELVPRPEAKADERLVVALCRVYDVDPYDVSAAIAARADRLSVLLRSNQHDDPDSVTRRYATTGVAA
jgi:hypothetical protein